jgi:hypothetical protein
MMMSPVTPKNMSSTSRDPSQCKTQLYFDRDIELVLCEENDNQCSYMRMYKRLKICVASRHQSTATASNTKPQI